MWLLARAKRHPHMCVHVTFVFVLPLDMTMSSVAAGHKQASVSPAVRAPPLHYQRCCCSSCLPPYPTPWGSRGLWDATMRSWPSRLCLSELHSPAVSPQVRLLPAYGMLMEFISNMTSCSTLPVGHHNFSIFHDILVAVTPVPEQAALASISSSCQMFVSTSELVNV